MASIVKNTSFFSFVTNVITMIHSVDDDANEISFIFPPVSN